MTIFLAILIVSLLLQALFAGYETGFVSSNPIRIRYIAEEDKDRRAVRLWRHIQLPDRMLTMLLIGTNAAMMLSSVMMANKVALYVAPEWTDLVATAILTPVILIFAEIMPKSFFRAHPNRLTLLFLPLVEVFYWILAPVTLPISVATRALLRRMGGERYYITPFMGSLEEVRHLVDEGVDQGSIEPEEQEMIHSVIDMQTTLANEIMVPRVNICAISENATREELLDVFEKSGHTRIPVYRDSVDTIIGLVNAYDVLTDEEPHNDSITRFVGEVEHVPDTMKVGDLFRMLKNTKQHLVIVTDEYGGTDGLITIENILEQIFGEIQDEYDKEERPIHKVGPHAYIVTARTALEDLAEAIGMTIEDEDVETVGGWLMHIAGRIPSPGEVVRHGQFQLTVLEGTPSSIRKIRLDIQA